MTDSEYVTTKPMRLGSNKLQAARYIRAISFEPPIEGAHDGSLLVRCSSEVDYQDIRRFLDEEHGTALSSSQGQWYVYRLDDDAKIDLPFPQHVNFRLEWRFRL